MMINFLYLVYKRYLNDLVKETHMPKRLKRGTGVNLIMSVKRKKLRHLGLKNRSSLMIHSQIHSTRVGWH